MQVIIINKDFGAWSFRSIKAAKPFILKNKEKDYFVKRIDGQSVRVYCCYNCCSCKNINCKYKED